MEFWGAILLLVLLVRWVILSRRMRELEQRLSDQSRASQIQESLIAKLTQRVRSLEESATPVAAEPPSPKPAAPEPVHAAPPPLPKPAPAGRMCQFCGRMSPPDAAMCVCGAVFDASRIPPPLPAEPAEPAEEPAAVHPVPPPLEPVPAVPHVSWRERLRQQVGDQEWEAVVGGNWLNKLGVLVLVIGIALFLGYAFTRMGPSGRVAIGVGVSLAMLIGGVLVERMPVYRIFARGLIGGGWAALYFTAYAMHALPAARVIDDPLIGTGLLLAVSAGMIVHSLQYRSQTVSGLAYFIAFASLAMSESTPFSVLALIPLAASLLYLAYRFDWTRMAVLGVAATYATCASRPDMGAPLATTQALFGCYWLLFETFDLLRLRRRERGFTIESLIFPLNALGFLGLSLVKWHRAAPEHFYGALAAFAALYVIGTLLRVRISGAISGYQGPLTLAAGLAAASIIAKASGMWINVGLLIEAELLFLTGVWFRQAYPRWLGGAVFCIPLGKLVGFDVPSHESAPIAGRMWMRWTPAALLTAAVFYTNRILRTADGVYYSSAAAALVLLVLGFETRLEYLCVAWLLFGAVLFELGVRTGKREFRWQAYLALLLGTGAGVSFNIWGPEASAPNPWVPLCAAAAIHYAVALRIRFGREGVLQPAERRFVPVATSVACAGFLTAAVWRVAPAGYLGLAWMVLGAVLLEFGLRKLPADFRWLSYLVSGAGFVNLVWFHVVQAEKGSGRAEWLSLSLAVLVCGSMSARLFPAMPERIHDDERGWVRDAYAAAAALFALTLAWLELPSPVVALAWAIVAVALLEIGLAAALARFRLLGNAASAAVIARLFLANFTDFGQTAGISHRVLTVVPIILSQYYVWWRYRQAQPGAWESAVARLYLYAPAMLTIFLMRFELGRTMAASGWALFGLLLFRIGLLRDLPDLRWQSYAIALLAFWRSWDTNFYIPGSLGGIGTRVLTGGIVIASFYVAQLFAPREPAKNLERYARPFYSLLASVLLAVLLFYEVSGGVLTVAWSVEGLALLAAGFPLRDRFQRLSGLFLFMVCVLKLFLYDLRRLETLNRILSFIALGAILVSVSWIYTRFRDRLQRYL